MAQPKTQALKRRPQTSALVLRPALSSADNDSQVEGVGRSTSGGAMGSAQPMEESITEGIIETQESSTAQLTGGLCTAVLPVPRLVQVLL